MDDDVTRASERARAQGFPDATAPLIHRWDRIRSQPTTLERGVAERALAGGTTGFHESVLRAHGVLEEATAMLARRDSAETVLTFIRWATDS